MVWSRKIWVQDTLNIAIADTVDRADNEIFKVAYLDDAGNRRRSQIRLR